MKRVAVSILLAILALMLVGCSRYPVVPLEVPGYGLESGDIVLIDTEREPETDDVVLYDAEVNRSHCMAFGPGVYLAKIIGVTGDRVSFSEYSYEVNGQIYASEDRYQIDHEIHRKPVKMEGVMWGTDKYGIMANMVLRVPEGEYLADKWVGLECPPGEYDEHGSIAYSRFTIKREAIEGIILKKVWHSKALEEYYKQIVY